MPGAILFESIEALLIDIRSSSDIRIPLLAIAR